MPILAKHQLRVAAVAELIGRRCRTSFDVKGVVLACLFHDMGNIIKSELGYFPESIQPEGLTYWEGVKADYIQTYGPDEHHATLEIAQELGLSKTVRFYIEGFGFSKMSEVARGNSFELKLCEYADMRVSPHGVVSVEERLREGSARYAQKQQSSGFSVEKFNELVSALRDVETEVFASCDLKPEDITEGATLDIQGDLKEMKM